MEILNNRDDASLPDKNGWPWPWENSLHTDYSYVFETDKVNGFCFGRPFDLQKYLSDGGSEDENYQGKSYGFFPDMSDIKNVDYGKRSGLIVISI